MPASRQVPDAAGRFGDFGGRYVPETLTLALDELAGEYDQAVADPQFQQQLETECPCDAQSNHGQYVRCVAHVVNDLVAAGLQGPHEGVVALAGAALEVARAGRDLDQAHAWWPGPAQPFRPKA